MITLRRFAGHAAIPIALVALALAPTACGGSSDGGGAGTATGGSGSIGSGTTTPSSIPATSPTSASSPSATPTATHPSTLVVSVYFLRGEFIGTAHRTVARTEATATAAMKALLAGPNAAEKAAGLTTAIPSGTTLRGIVISNGLATVDLSKTYESGGGTLSMTARLAQVVYTLTQFPTVKGVNFELDGEAVTVFGGEGIVLGHPQSRSDYESVTPPIFVETPAPFDVVGALPSGVDALRSLTVRGTANVFEATFRVKLIHAHGKKLAAKTVTATSGTGTRGAFSVRLTFATADTTGKLIVYEASAKDGSPINVVEIPLTFAH
jgi:hypothetical protein